MAVNFALTRKSAPEAGPVNLGHLDVEIARAFGEEPHAVRYYYGWFDSIGYRLAQGMTWDEVREALTPRTERDLADADYCAFLARLREITTWLEERFTVESWTSWGRSDSEPPIAPAG
jgi:hypothetical protein